MITTYWPLLLTLAGILGLVDQTKLAWVCILLAGLFSLLG
jgi:hypothetical protein